MAEKKERGDCLVPSSRFESILYIRVYVQIRECGTFFLYFFSFSLIFFETENLKRFLRRTVILNFQGFSLVAEYTSKVFNPFISDFSFPEKYLILMEIKISYSTKNSIH